MSLRLRGEVAGRMRSFALGAGEARVGSAPGNAIVLAVPGVSRLHAVVRPTPDGHEVRDEGSKNGVHVNGSRVSVAPLRPDDEVRFGPVALRVEEVDAGDLELAVAFGDPGVASAAAADGSTGSWGAAGRADESLDALERLIPLFRAGAPGLPAALDALVDEFALQGSCLLEVRGDDLVVVAAAGTAIDIDEAKVAEGWRERRAAGGASSWRSAGPPEAAFACAPGAPPRVLGAWTDGSAARLEVVLRIAAQLVTWGDGPPSERGTPPARGPLVFPAHHVRGASAAMTALYEQMADIADTDLPVLVLGETGVGKEDVARALHLSSSRAAGPFVAVNCAAIPADLLEAELFGVGKGAATGVAPRAGRFQLAHRGTLLLDEIGDMPVPLQAKLLRALETKEVEPLASAPVTVDLRIVSATHADVGSLVEGGRFRPDLYYRLCGALLRVPPLRERREDIPALAAGILRPIVAASGKPIAGITTRALRVLAGYSWPGNVRELAHELQRLVHACAPGAAIESALVRDGIRDAPAAAGGDGLDLATEVAHLERRLIEEALTRSGGNRTEAARLLGISRNGLAMKMDRLGLSG